MSGLDLDAILEDVSLYREYGGTLNDADHIVHHAMTLIARVRELESRLETAVEDERIAWEQFEEAHDRAEKYEQAIRAFSVGESLEKP
jgi:hypothetical protein